MKRGFAVLPALAALAAFPCWAQAADNALIIDSGQQDVGVVSVNQAAGTLNQQANLRALAVSAWNAQADTAAQQEVHGNAIRLQMQPAHAEIAGSAFAGSSGLIGVNQTAGVANQTNNQVAIALAPNGVAAVADAALALASVGRRSLATAGGAGTVAIGDQAFQGASGVVQVNQVAGAWNHTANILAVRFAH